MRNITLSTCGLVDRIYDLLDLSLQLTLTVLLRAPNDEIRQQIMSIAKKYDMDSPLRCCHEYAGKTGRRVTFEYTLIKGVNDRANNARQLAQKLSGMLCHVNLIPVNNVDEIDNSASLNQDIINFKNVLKINGINATIRRTLGADINASYGQLRRQKNRNI